MRRGRQRDEADGPVDLEVVPDGEEVTVATREMRARDDGEAADGAIGRDVADLGATAWADEAADARSSMAGAERGMLRRWSRREAHGHEVRRWSTRGAVGLSFGAHGRWWNGREEQVFEVRLVDHDAVDACAAARFDGEFILKRATHRRSACKSHCRPPWPLTAR
jgi:hypothetical protein